MIAVLLVIGIGAPARAEVTQAQLSEARARVNQKSAELEAELANLDRILARQASFESRIYRIHEELAARDREIALSAFAAKEQARAMYVSAGASGFQVVATPDGITRLGTKSAYLEAVVELDVDAVNQLVFLQNDRISLQAELQVLLEDQRVIAEEVEAATADLLDQLGEVNADYQALYGQWQKEEAERRRRAAEEAARRQAAAAQSAARATSYASSAFVDPSGRTCPVAGANTFRDSWLEPRAYRNGYHHGTDLIAAAGTPLVAMEAGYIYSMGYHWAGGNGLYIRGNSGDIYYYAHLQGYAAGLKAGDRVGVAQLVGYVGNTGASSMAHLHLGYQPGGGAMVNPYQLLVKLCR